ncbi:signal peptidase I [Modestobacter sp. URMC 112]
MTTTALAPTAPGTEGTALPRPDQAAPPAPAAGLPAQLLRWTVRLVMLVAVLAFAGLAVGPHVLGYRTMTMLTGSMSPDIDPGDVIVVTPLPISQVQAGMVISYHIPIDDHRLVTHRVLAVETSPDGAVTVQTKGDANDAPDPWRATLQGSTAWQVSAVIPELGHAIEFLRTPALSHTLVYGAPALLAGWLLLSLWAPTGTDDLDGGQQA